MAEDHEVHFSTRLPETVLAPYEPDVLARLALAEQRAPAERRDAVAAVAASSRAASRPGRRWPSWLRTTWPAMPTPASAITGASTPYGVQGGGERPGALERTGDRGFLRCLEQLRRAAEAIGRTTKRCAAP